MIKPYCPCIDCNDRTATCHGECGYYKQYKENLDYYKRKVIEEKKRPRVIYSKTRLNAFNKKR